MTVFFSSLGDIGRLEGTGEGGILFYQLKLGSGKVIFPGGYIFDMKRALGVFHLPEI